MKSGRGSFAYLVVESASVQREHEACLVQVQNQSVGQPPGPLEDAKEILCICFSEVLFSGSHC
jgi:hypothetical protein